MVDATQTTNTNDDLEGLTGRVSELERRLAIHNHADPYSQPIWVGNPTQGTANVVKPPSTGIMGENCSNGDALGFGTGVPITTIIAANAGGEGSTADYPYLSNGSPTYYIAQKIVSPTTSLLTGSYIYSELLGGPGYNSTISIYLYSNKDNTPGTQLIKISSASDYTSDWSWRTRGGTCSPYQLIGGTSYWLVYIWDSGSLNALRLAYTTGNPYSSGSVATSTDGGVTWTLDTDKDLQCRFVLTTDASKLYRSTSLSTAELGSYVGISNKSCKQGETADITTWGFKNDYSGLTVGAPYYLTDAAGVIGTAPGTYTKQIGIGFSPTTLLIGSH